MKKRIKDPKAVARIRRSKKARSIIRRANMPRLSVHKTSQHIYVQLIASEHGSFDRVLAQASSLEQLPSSELKGKVGKAAQVGALIAERVKALKIEKVAFDRSGFKYHGRIKALADAAREGGLIF